MHEDIQKGVATLQTLVDKIIEFLVNYSFQVIGAVIVLVLGWKAGQWAAKAILRFLEKKRVDSILSRFAAGIVKGFIVGFAVIVALGKFGITITPLIAGLSALAFGSTFAIQGPLSNFGAGLSILMSRPFVPGNTITVAGVSGVVEEVKLGYTILSTEDGEKLTIPNKHIVGEVLRNSFGCRVVESVVGISYGDDPERAIGIIRQILQASADIAQTPPPLIGIQAFGDSSINLGLRYWVPTRRYFQIMYATNLAVYKALKQAGITIPFPQREVRLLQPDSLTAQR